MPLFIFYERIDRVDPVIGFVARGRHALFNGKLEDAVTFLKQAQRLKPDSYEAALLEAEIALKEGRSEAAKALLNELFKDVGAPEWVRQMADSLLLKIP
jgi:thioredoxin-like negative regulator of GroEL